jgi:uncharacterized protein YndB with AHSA1/START domain
MAPDGDYGERREVDGAESLTFRRRLRHPPRVVWQALTDAGEFSAWHIGQVLITPGVGGRIEAVAGPGDFRWRGEILTWVPDATLIYEMVAEAQAHPHGGERSLVHYELQPIPEGTLLTLRHTRLSPATAASFAPGSHVLLDRLAARLEQLPLPDWTERFATVAGHYRGDASR